MLRALPRKALSAFVVLLLVSVPAVSQGVPGSSKIESRPGCDLEIHTPNVGADKQGAQAEDTIDIRVRNPYTTEDCAIWRFLFIAQPGAGLTWVTGEDKNEIRGVPAAGDWQIDVSASCSGPDALPTAGRVSAGQCNTLVFTAPMKMEMKPGGFADFTLSLSIDQTIPYCMKIPIGVVGVHMQQQPAGSGQYSHSDVYAAKAGDNGREFELVVDQESVEAQVLPDFSYIWDDDHNGHIDHAWVQFNKELDPDTVEVGDWNIGRKTADSDEYPVLKARVETPPAAPNDEYCPLNSTLIIKFDEEDAYDTGGDEEGIMPEISYRVRANSAQLDARMHEILTTYAGERVTSQTGVVPLDKALPVLVSSIIQLDEEDPEYNTRVLVTFSEPVQGQGTDCQDAIEPLTAADFELAWGSSTAVQSADTIAHVHPAHVAGEPRVWLEFTGPDTDPATRIEEADLEYRFEQQQSHNRIEPNAKPHRMRPGAEVCDLDGNNAWRICEPALGAACIDTWKPFSEPHIVSVDGNIGFNKVTVRFSTAVNISADFLSDPGRLFTVIEGRGPSGVTGIEFTPGSDKAILSLDAPLKPEDVTGDETYLRLLGGEIWAAYTEENNGTQDGTPWFLPTQDQYMVDVTPPSIMFALTRDLDSNGRLDSYELRISEPVVDLRFQEGSPGDPGVVLAIEGHDTYRRIDIGRTNDANLTIGFQPNTDFGGYATHRLPQFVALRQPNGTGLGPGLITDQAVDPNFPDLVIGNWMDNVTATDVLELDGAPPVVMDAFTVDRDEDGLIDGFVVIFSEPVNDTSFDPGHWTVVHPGDNHIYPVLGMLPIHSVDARNEWDHYEFDPVIVLDLEERPLDPQRPVGDTGIPVPDIRYFAPLGEGLQDLADLPTSVGPIFLGGPNRMLNFGSNKVVERDESRPVLMRALGCEGFPSMALYFSEGVGVVDVPGEPMRAVQEQDLFYSNGNGPNVGGEPAASGFKTDTVRHNVGDAVLYVELDGPLHADDFVKDKIKIVPDPAAGPQSPDDSVVQEVGGTLHTGNESADFGPAADVWPPEGIIDARIMKDALGADKLTPGSVTLQWTIPDDEGCLDAGVTAYDVRAQNMDTNGTPISASNFGLIQNPSVLGVEYTWYDSVKQMNRTSSDPLTLRDEFNVSAGKTLQARIYGLTPDANYQIAVRTLDNATNRGPISNVITLKTPKDPTPPIKPVGWQLRSSTHPVGVAVKANITPLFDWDAALDNETIFPFYIYDVTNSTNYTPDVTAAGKKRIAPCVGGVPCNTTLDAKAVAEIVPGRPGGLAPLLWFDDPASWYFHLSACSGGGCTLLESYHFRVDSIVNRSEMLAVNAQVSYDVVYDEASRTTTIAWALPNATVLPEACIENKPGAQKRFEGVQVWRRTTGEYELLGTFGSDSHAYRSGSFRDTENASAKATYLVTAYCPDLAVTFYDPATDSFAGDLMAGPGYFPAGRSPGTGDYPGTAASVDKAPPNLLWLWILLGVLALLVIVGLIAYATMRGRGTEERWEEGELEEQEAGMGDAGSAPGDGTHAPDGPHPGEEDEW